CAGPGRGGQWLQAWRWLQDLGRAIAASGPMAELNIRRLLTLLGGCLHGLGGEWAWRQWEVQGAPAELLEAWAAEAEVEFRKAQAAVAAGRRAAWQGWVAGSVKRRPGLLYRWGRVDEVPVYTAAVAGGQWTLDPREVVEKEAAA
ncbi:MAG: hypothetical protein ACKPKO_49290, partial [Candidatus Fonsibacter sp.]